MSDRVLMAVLRHGSQTSSVSAVKRPATEFLARLSLVSSLICGKVPSRAQELTLHVDWFLGDLRADVPW